MRVHRPGRVAVGSLAGGRASARASVVSIHFTSQAAAITRAMERIRLSLSGSKTRAE